MPDPGDTAAGDTGVGTGWSRDDNTSTGSSSVGFSGGTLNGSDNYSGGNWGGSNSSGNNWGGTNSSTSNWTGSDSGNSSSYGFSGGTLNGSDNYSGNNWGATNSGSPVGTNASTTSPNGGIAGALNAGLGSEYSNPITQSSNASTGYYHSFTDTIPGMNNPNQFDKGIYRTNLVNVYGTPMDTWSNAYDPNKLTSGAQKIHQAILDNALRLGTPVDYFSGKRTFNPQTGTTQHSLGQAIDIRINDPVTGLPVGYDQIGSLANNPIGNTRLGYRSPEQAKRIQAALEGPYKNFAAGVIGSFYNNPDVYGAFDNQRWGGAFETGKFSKDYMHFDEGKAATGVSAAQRDLRQLAQGTLASQVTANAATPTRLAMAGLGGGLFDMAFGDNTVSPSYPALSDPYTNIAEKGDLQQPPPVQTSQYAGYGNFNVPYGAPQGVQQTYSVPGGAGVLGIDNLTFGPPVQQTPTQVANVVPSWQQSAYTGPIQTAMNETPSVPPSQEGEPIPFPVDEDSLGYKTWRGLTYVGDQLIPGSGMMLRKMDEDLKQRWPSMTNAERQALIDRWDGNNSPSGGVSTVSYGSGALDPGVGGADRGNYQTSMVTQPVQQNLQQYQQDQSSDDTTWKRIALMYGFTPQQVNDPQTAEYIKQLYDMGWLA